MVNTKERERIKRTIINKHKKENPKKKKIYAISAGLIALLMVFSGFLYAILSNPNQTDSSDYIESFDFNGIEFKKHIQGHFVALYPYANKIIPFSFYLDPRNADEITITDNVRSIKSSTKVYVAYNPNSNNTRELSAAATEFARILPFSHENISVVAAFTEDTNPINEYVPVKTCDDANFLTSVVIFRTGINATRIYAKDNCIFVEAQNYSQLLLASDRFAYSVLGIIPFKDYWGRNITQSS